MYKQVEKTNKTGLKSTGNSVTRAGPKGKQGLLFADNRTVNTRQVEPIYNAKGGRHNLFKLFTSGGIATLNTPRKETENETAQLMLIVDTTPQKNKNTTALEKLQNTVDKICIINLKEWEEWAEEVTYSSVDGAKWKRLNNNGLNIPWFSPQETEPKQYDQAITGATIQLMLLNRLRKETDKSSPNKNIITSLNTIIAIVTKHEENGGALGGKYRTSQQNNNQRTTVEKENEELTHAFDLEKLDNATTLLKTKKANAEALFVERFDAFSKQLLSYLTMCTIDEGINTYFDIHSSLHGYNTTGREAIHNKASSMSKLIVDIMENELFIKGTEQEGKSNLVIRIILHAATAIEVGGELCLQISGEMYYSLHPKSTFNHDSPTDGGYNVDSTNNKPSTKAALIYAGCTLKVVGYFVRLVTFMWKQHDKNKTSIRKRSEET